VTHHDVPVKLDTIEILRAGQWSVIQTADPAQAQWLWDQLSDYVFPQSGVDVQRVDYAVWKQPSATRGYVARASLGREPDCPNCMPGGCPDRQPQTVMLTVEVQRIMMRDGGMKLHEFAGRARKPDQCRHCMWPEHSVPHGHDQDILVPADF
jgi:hypothetical protein